MDAKSPQRGAPEFAGDQRTEILRLLREAGPQGVSKESLIFDHHFTQCGARVFELEKQGYQIRHESRDGERYVYFVLIGEPAERSSPTSDSEPDYARRTRELRDKAMPLFAGKT